MLLSSIGDFDVYSEGISMYKRRGTYGTRVGEDAFDRVRKTLEACDGVQGFMFNIDLNSAFGGFAGEMIVELRDECPSVPICSFGIVPSSEETCKSSRDISRRGLNVGFSCAALAEHSSLWFPIEYKSENNSKIAQAVETLTSPFRFSNERVSTFVSTLVPRPKMNLVSLSTCIITSGGEEKYVWDETKLESLLRIRGEKREKSVDFSMYTVFRSHDERDESFLKFTSYARERCRRVRSCRVSEETSKNERGGEEEDEEQKEETLRAYDMTKKSTFKSCVLAANTNESFEFLERVSTEFSKKIEHIGMMRYFAETGVDEEEYNDVSERLSNMKRFYNV